jgi:hypothetical protein
MSDWAEDEASLCVEAIDDAFEHDERLRLGRWVAPRERQQKIAALITPRLHKACERGRADLAKELLCDKHKHMSAVGGCRYCACERGRAEASAELAKLRIDLEAAEGLRRSADADRQISERDGEKLREELAKAREASEPLPCGHPRACLRDATGVTVAVCHPDFFATDWCSEHNKNCGFNRQRQHLMSWCAWCADLEKERARQGK